MSLAKLIRYLYSIFDSVQRFLKEPNKNSDSDERSELETETEKTEEENSAPRTPPEKQEGAKSQRIQQSASPPETRIPKHGDIDTGDEEPDSMPQVLVKHVEDANPAKKVPPKRLGARGKREQRKSSVKPKSSPEVKPELICREVHNQWNIFLVFPEGKNADVSQGGSRLESTNGREYLLSNFTKEVTWSENGKPEIITLFNNSDPLIFKLRKDWDGDGREVKHVSDGYYVVFAPRRWERTDDAPVESSETRDDGFLAHYFFSDGSGKPGGFDECAPIVSQKRFSIEGQIVTDDLDCGALYVSKSPELTDANNWQGVSWVRVGEEGGEWGESFKPKEKALASVIGKREGWFYVRIYDEDVKMIDSFDFRLLPGLKEILIDGKSYSSENVIVPNATGYTETTIQFIGDNIVIENKSGDGNSNPYVTVRDNNTVLVAPHSDADKTRWTLNEKTDIVVHLPRIWWRLDNTDDEPEEWRATAFEMSRDKFRHNRHAKIVVRLPSAVEKIDVGFDSFEQYGGALKYPTVRNENDDRKRAEFKLRDFCYHETIETSSEQADLRIRCGETAFSVVRILADAPPPNPNPPDPRDISCLPEEFVYPVTGNKGFSLGELDAVGLTQGEAKRLGFRIDQRRRSKHRANIRVLQTEEKGSNAN